MAYLDHINRCNNFEPAHFHSFIVEGKNVGRVHNEIAAALRAKTDIFRVANGRVELNDSLSTPAERTEALRGVARDLVAAGLSRKLRNEDYPVIANWGDTPLLQIDRGIVPSFGIRAFGVHVNGYIGDHAEGGMWIGTRAADKAIEPNKLDNVVAGGQPVGLTLIENVVKESAEEADIPKAMAIRAKPVGLITYAMEEERGLRRDTLFLYDLPLDPNFVPRNTDGELARFDLMKLSDVAEKVRATKDFKFNVSLIIIDFLLRHGFISPDSEPDYERLARGLHGPL